MSNIETVFRTSDGTIHESMNDAEEHETIIQIENKLKDLCAVDTSYFCPEKIIEAMAGETDEWNSILELVTRLQEIRMDNMKSDYHVCYFPDTYKISKVFKADELSEAKAYIAHKGLFLKTLKQVKRSQIGEYMNHSL